MKVIDKFEGKYRFLSNFHNSKVVWNGIEFQNSEAAFHSAKILNNREQFAQLNPSEAKKLGRRVKLRDDWDNIKDGIMYEVLVSKFSNNPKLKTQLLETGDAELVEGNTWNDTYWGVCKGKGLNKLGQILMRIRKEIREREMKDKPTTGDNSIIPIE